MIIYNVTVTVEESICNEWLDWIKKEHIPEILSLGVFSSAQINKIINNRESENTFAIAYKCLDMKKLHEYQSKYAISLQKKHSDKFGQKAIAFRTLMQVISEF